MNRSPVPVLPDRVLSVAAADKRGHESLFAYPEVGCESYGPLSPGVRNADLEMREGCPGRLQPTRH